MNDTQVVELIGSGCMLFGFIVGFWAGSPSVKSLTKDDLMPLRKAIEEAQAAVNKVRR